MVGVPGRSGGCNTCRRRKKGCDKQRPACTQCLRLHLVCEGYAKPLLWITNTPLDSPKSALVATHSHQTRDGLDTRALVPVVPWAVQYRRAAAHEVEIPLANDLASSAREQLYLGYLYGAVLPHGRPYSDEAADLSSNGWTSVIERLSGSRKLVRYMIMALSTALLASHTGDGQLQHKATQGYSVCLQAMAKALDDPRRTRPDCLLATMRLMQLYELLLGTATNWWKHMQGTIAFLLHCGPEEFKSDPGHKLFVDTRINVIMLYTSKRVKSPFSSKEWRVVPWTNRPKSTKDSFLDIMDDIPGLLEQFDEWHACSVVTKASRKREQLLSRCWMIRDALDSWGNKHTNKLRQFDYTATHGPVSAPQSDVEFALLHLVQLYWVACLILHHTIGEVAQQTDTDLEPGRRQVPRVCPSVFAAKIARSICLFFQPAAGYMQSGSGLFPMTVAMRYYDTADDPSQPSKEAEILRQVFHHRFISAHVGRFLEGLGSVVSSNEQQLLLHVLRN